MTMYSRWIVVILIFLYATDSAHASHFRGGVIMVRPKLGGAAREVRNERTDFYLGFRHNVN